ncbi:CDP-diacylglycerol--serine O-phosphatidyltransferase [Massilia sp. G4R7]|uniref:CDP-diacylglycerol--serine O-phosphatidyltransferase n=1 Tax=Massilia phyllostachyos TaxID=2898585 RepID=A0ABS8QAH6_9BURK|nr:CDP-diacylglycerol--serine O-phosphatidyltransferase [Massilia phyllostachyos]MCD2518749.1 CDP-diacylglycerol--serine O-phosphatidyltransferase [Massilia phyllostachyos]
MPTFPRRRTPGAAPKAPRFSRIKKRFGRRAEDRMPGERGRGIYLLPNAFTTGALFCGFYAIVMAMNQRFEHACWAVFIAMVLDGLDGRIARLTNTQSEFGAQYDSLSDMVSFGAAPALVIYEWSLRGLGKLGWIAAFIYCAGAALRLARFNTNIEVVDKRFFQGLPSPAAAALVVGFIMMMTDPDINVSSRKVDWVSWAIAVFAGLTMVSNVPFYSFKDINFKKSVPFIVVFLIALAFALVAIDPPKVLWPIFVIYGLSGYAVFAWRAAKGKPVSIIPRDDEDEDDVKGLRR